MISPDRFIAGRQQHAERRAGHGYRGGRTVAAVEDHHLPVRDDHHPSRRVGIVDAQMAGRAVKHYEAGIRAEGAELNEMCLKPWDAVHMR